MVSQLDVSKPAEAKAKAEKAVDALGTNCIPRLLWLIKQQDSRVKEWGIRLDQQLSFIDLRIEPASVHHERALAAFRILGLRAEPFVHQLNVLLEQKETAVAATAALSNLGLAAVPAFCRAMTNDHSRVRAAAARELGYRRDGAGSMSLLIKALSDDPAPEVRCAAALALSRFDDEPEVVVPALITALDDEHPQVGLGAASSLGQLGSKAQKAVPRLKKLATAHGPLASGASGALIRINPKSAREIGIVIPEGLESFE